MLPSLGQSEDDDDLRAGNIDADLCTHINAAFATIVNNSLSLDETQLKALGNLVRLKEKNKNLNVLVSVGGAGDDVGFADMVLDHRSRKT